MFCAKFGDLKQMINEKPCPQILVPSQQGAETSFGNETAVVFRPSFS